MDLSPIQPMPTMAAPAITQRVVIYYWEQDGLSLLPEKDKAAAKYLQEKNVQQEAEYIDKLDRKRKHFPQLETAIKYCQQHNVRLLIARLHNLTTSEEFTDL